MDRYTYIYEGKEEERLGGGWLRRGGRKGREEKQEGRKEGRGETGRKGEMTADLPNCLLLLLLLRHR